MAGRQVRRTLTEAPPSLSIYHCHQPKSALRCSFRLMLQLTISPACFDAHNSLHFESGDGFSLEQSVGKALRGGTATGGLVPSASIRRIVSRSHPKHSLPWIQGSVHWNDSRTQCGSTVVHHLGLWRFHESRRFVLHLISRRSSLSAPNLAIVRMVELTRASPLNTRR